MSAFLALDRRRAMAGLDPLPNTAEGTVLLADLSGFTELASRMVDRLGTSGGAEAVIRLLDRVYTALIAPLHAVGGSAIAFSGDAVLCWLPGAADSLGLALAAEMQAALAGVASPEEAELASRELAIKIAMASGRCQRGAVGDPIHQRFDILTGAPVARVGQLIGAAGPREILIDRPMFAQMDSVDRAMVHALQPRRASDSFLGLSLESADHLVVRPRFVEAVANVRGGQAIPDLEPDEVERWLPADLRSRMRQGAEGFVAELRYAAALFLGFDRTGASGEESSMRRLDRWVRHIQALLHDHDGSLAQVTLGDKGSYIYAVFGAFRAVDDPCYRAAVASRKLVDSVRVSPGLRLPRVGMGYGRMVVGSYGSSVRKTIGAFGSETNIAAKLMQDADDCENRLSTAFARALSGRYRLIAAVSQPQAARAKMPVWTLGEAQPADEPLGHHGEPEFVGREEELERFDRIIEQASGPVSLIRLGGEAGVGKSRLLQEVARRAAAAGLRRLHAQGEVGRQSEPYAALRPIFISLFGLHPPEVDGGTPDLPTTSDFEDLARRHPAWRDRLPALGDLLGVDLPETSLTRGLRPEARRDLRHGMAFEALQLQAGPRFCVLIDDAQWLDAASIDLIRDLARRGQGSVGPWVIAHREPANEALYRLDDLVQARQLSLNALGEEDSLRLIRSLFGAKAEASVVAILSRLAQGNPFMAQALVTLATETEQLRRVDGKWCLAETPARRLREAGCLVRDPRDGGWHLDPSRRIPIDALGLPESAHAVVLARRDRLEEPHALTLKVASVLERGSLDLLRDAHPETPGADGLAADLDRLVADAWLSRRGPEWAFSQAIAREVIYGSLLGEQRRKLHALAAVALETQGSEPGRLALHFEAAGVQDRALDYLSSALATARQQDANETALSLVRRLESLDGENPRWVQTEIELLLLLGRSEETSRAIERFGGIAAASPFEMAWLRARHHERLGEYGASIESLEAAETLASSVDPTDDARARCQWLRGTIARRRGDYEAAIQAFGSLRRRLEDRPARELTRAQASLLQAALDGEGVVLREMGDLESARRLLDRALKLARRRGDARAEADSLNHLGVTAFLQHDLDAAAQNHRRALEIRRLIGDRPGEGASLQNLAQVYAVDGALDKALDRSREALEIQLAADNRWEVCNLRIALANTLQLLGELEASLDQADEGLLLAEELGDISAQAFLLCNRGAVEREMGRMGPARENLTEALRLARSIGARPLVGYCRSYLARVELDARRPAQARAHAEEARRIRSEVDPAQISADHASLAEANLALGDLAAAGRWVDRGLEALSAHPEPGPEYPHRDYLACHRVLRSLGRDDDAQRAIEQAGELLLARAARIETAPMRERFLEGVPEHRDILESGSA